MTLDLFLLICILAFEVSTTVVSVILAHSGLGSSPCPSNPALLRLIRPTSFIIVQILWNPWGIFLIPPLASAVDLIVTVTESPHFTPKQHYGRCTHFQFSVTFYIWLWYHSHIRKRPKCLQNTLHSVWNTVIVFLPESKRRRLHAHLL